MRRLGILFFSAFVILLFPFYAFALRVELYPQGAIVERSIEVPAGKKEVKLFLPYSSPFDTFRVRAQGFSVASISFSRVYLSDDEVPAIRDLKRKIRSLEEEKRKALNEKQGAELSLKMFETLLKKVEMESPSDAQSWLTLVEDRINSYVMRISKVDQKIEELDKKIKLLRKKLSEIDTPDARRRTLALIKIEGNKSGGKLFYSFYSPEAGWSPEYKLVLKPRLKRVHVLVYASIWQKTGEDWKDAKIVLSSERKGFSLTPPEERNLLVSLEEKERALKAPFLAAPAPMLASSAKGRGGEKVSFEEGALGVKISLKEAFSIPSTGEKKRVLVWKGNLKVEDIYYLCRPYSEASAYRMVKVKLSSPFDFLSGVAQFYVGGTFLGKKRISGMTREGKYKLCFGNEERIEVKRKLLKLEEKEKGIFTKGSVRENGYEITLKNLTGSSVKLVVDEVIPVSVDSRVEVKLIKVSPEPFKKTGTGHIIWKVALGKGEEAKLKFAYRISYPQGKRLEFNWR